MMGVIPNSLPSAVPPVRVTGSPCDNAVMLYLSDLSKTELQSFKQVLLKQHLRPSSAHVPWGLLRMAQWPEVVHILIEHFPGRRAWDAARDILAKMNKRNLCALVEEEVNSILPNLEQENLNPREAKVNLDNEDFDKLLAYKLHVTNKYSPVWNKTDWPGNQADFLYQKIHKHEMFLPCLLLPKKPQATQPKTVVILGVSGIGKTTLARQVILSWAQDSFYAHKFWYAFYIYCPGIGLGHGRSFSELLVEQWPAFEDSVSKILSQPDRLLLVLDGFDELRSPFIQEPACLSADCTQKLPGPLLLSSLLTKKMVPEATLLVLTGLASWKAIRPLLRSFSLVTLNGFDKSEKIRYFKSYFQSASEINQVLPFAMKNGFLFSLCRIPVICWIVCSVLKDEITKGSNFRQSCANTSSLLALYLSALLLSAGAKRGSQTPTDLENLCCLAAQGMWDMTWVFTKKDLQQARLGETSIATLLGANILRRVRGPEDHYIFTVFLFQEYLAALFYVLWFPQRLSSYHVLGHMEIQNLVANPRGCLNWLSHTGIFLFGLLNPEILWIVSSAFSCKLLLENKQKILKVLAELHEYEPSAPSHGVPQLFYCLCENREEDVVTQALRGYYKATLEIDGEGDLWASAFCLKHCRDLKGMELTVTENLREELEPGPDDNYRFTMNKGISIYDEWWQNICSVFETNDSLRSLTLAKSILEPRWVKVFADALKHPRCKLQNLHLNRVSPEVCHEDLLQVLLRNRHLNYLEIQHTLVRNMAMKTLCTAVKSPECGLRGLVLENCMAHPRDWIDFACSVESNLQISLKTVMLRSNYIKLFAVHYLSVGHIKRLALENCNLSPSSCENIAFCMSQSTSLTHLSLAENDFKNEGARHIWRALQNLMCPLKRLVLRSCGLTPTCCLDISFTLKINKTLNSLDLSFNNLYNDGFILLCEALIGTNCNLQILELERCLFTWAGCQVSAPVLYSNSSLCYLDVSQNNLGPEGVMLLARAFVNHRTVLLEKRRYGAGGMQARLIGPVAREGMLQLVQEFCQSPRGAGHTLC